MIEGKDDPKWWLRRATAGPVQVDAFDLPRFYCSMIALSVTLLVASISFSSDKEVKQGGTSFSTPEAAVLIFIRAAIQRDADTLSRCFSQHAAGEFRPLREKRATPEMLAELANMFTSATVTNVDVTGDRAQVQVLLPNDPRGRETLTLEREGGQWRIVDF